MVFQRGGRVVAAAAFLLVGVACSDSGDEAGQKPASSSTTASESSPGEEPVRGGELTVMAAIAPRSFDPAKNQVTPSNGANELLAVYDTIMQWNPDTEEYEPRTAESLESNADHTEWTLTLRPDISFVDGTPYDAEAVRINFERHMADTTTLPTRSWLSPIQEMEVEDPLTITFRLDRSWGSFPFVLANQPGMLVSPTALEALGDPASAGYAERKAAFDLNPVGAGAGPFVVESNTPGESIVMVRNDDYWNGPAYLDRITFLPLTGGDPGALDSLESGGVDMAWLRNPVIVNEAMDAGVEGIATPVSGYNLALMNVGGTVDCVGGVPEAVCAGQPDGPTQIHPVTEQDDVRSAIVAAIDPEALNDRVYGGAGIGESRLVGENSPFFSDDLESPEFDPERAAELVEAAEAAGWDGSLTLLGHTIPDRQDWAIAVEGMLESVGMDVTVELIEPADQYQRLISRDFELAWFTFLMTPDDGAIFNLLQNLSPSGERAFAGDSPEIQEALDELLAASTPEERRAAMADVSAIYSEGNFSLATLESVELMAHGPQVEGLYKSVQQLVYFDRAWLSE